jgi:uncharacterized protein (TIGR04222 family)
MNPFDLSGPPFLLFYAALVAAVSLAVRLGLRLLEGEASGTARPMALTRDPYAVAYLHGGRSQALQTALISLMDRGLLVGGEAMLKAADAEAIRKTGHPLEQALLSAFGIYRAPDAAFTDTGVVSALDAVGAKLEDQGLIYSQRLRTAGRLLFWLSFLSLLAVAGTKIVIALSRGRTNVLFLIFLALIAPLLLRKAAEPFRTLAGRRSLAGLKMAFADLYSRRGRVKLHRPTTELMMLAALFGLGALPAAARPMADAVKKLKSRRESGGGCGSGCGSGSSCGGSSCGGGGCGGGCGGCG